MKQKHKKCVYASDFFCLILVTSLADIDITEILSLFRCSWFTTVQDFVNPRSKPLHAAHKYLSHSRVTVPAGVSSYRGMLFLKSTSW